jgi:hypothetical protein
MALEGREGETRVARKQIQRGCKWAMETRATAIKAGRRRHKWAMVQATATIMYHKGSSFYNKRIGGLPSKWKIFISIFVLDDVQ